MVLVTLVSDRCGEDGVCRPAGLGEFTTYLNEPINKACDVAVIDIGYPSKFLNLKTQWWVLKKKDGTKIRLRFYSKHIHSFEDLYKDINSILKPEGVSIQFKLVGRRLQATNKTEYEVDLDQAGEMLGFYGKIYPNTTTDAGYERDIYGGNHFLMVESDIVEPQFVGSTRLPLLDKSPLLLTKIAKPSTMPIIHHEKRNPVYKPVSRSYIDRINVKFRSEQGQIIEFTGTGRLYITLDIRTE